MVPHLRHSGLMVVILVAVGIYIMRALVKETKRKNAQQLTVVMQSHVIGLELTFAGLHAFRPLVINMSAAKSSAVLEPSTARSATTDSA